MALQVGVTGTQISLVPTGCAIRIVDTTNYDVDNDPPDPAHLRANFNKKHIIVINPDNIVWTMDSILTVPTVDQEIDPPSSGSSADTVQYDFNTNDGNGVYQVELFSVPTREGGVSYNVSAGHIVYYNGVFYRTTINGNTSVPDLLVGWAVVDYDYLRTTGTKYYATQNVTINCLTSSTYMTSLTDTATRRYDLETDDNCRHIRITDHSLYADNTEGGHNIDDFSDYRTIVVFRPGSSSDVNDWVMSSVAALNPDEAISAPASGNNEIYYNFQEGDKDGLYTVAICSYPTWRDSASYTANPITVVYYNGALYKLLQANTNQVPDAPDSEYWEPYVLDGTSEYLTRYCYIGKVAVFCRTIDACKERAIYEAACLIRENPCNDDILCNSPKLMKANKISILHAAIPYAMQRREWEEVEKNFDLINTFCNC